MTDLIQEKRVRMLWWQQTGLVISLALINVYLIETICSGVIYDAAYISPGGQHLGIRTYENVEISTIIVYTVISYNRDNGHFI